MSIHQAHRFTMCPKQPSGGIWMALALLDEADQNLVKWGRSCHCRHITTNGWMCGGFSVTDVQILWSCTPGFLPVVLCSSDTWWSHHAFARRKCFGWSWSKIGFCSNWDVAKEQKSWSWSEKNWSRSKDISDSWKSHRVNEPVSGHLKHFFLQPCPTDNLLL